MLLNNQWVKEETKKKFKKYLERNEKATYQNLWGTAKNNSEREVPSNKCLHQETRKILNTLTLTSKDTRNIEEMKSKVSRRKEIKIRLGIIIIGNKKTTGKIGVFQNWSFVKINRQTFS